MPVNTTQRRVISMTDASTPLLQHAAPSTQHAMTMGASDMTLHSATAVSTRGALTKKLVLWLVLLLQVCFISSLWLLQLGGLQTNSGNEAALSFGGGKTAASGSDSASNSGVNFIRKATQLTAGHRQNVWPVRVPLVSNFRKDFYQKLNRLNKTDSMEDDIALRFVLDAETELWCFREGTANETVAVENEVDDSLRQWDEQQCNCRNGWHGRDCGQPEVIWRTLLTAKSPFKLQDPSKSTVHRLVYLMEGNFFNLDLLELQMRTVQNVVDFFILYIKKSNTQPKQLKALERRVRGVLRTRNYKIIHCRQLRAKTANCTASHAYQHFKQTLQKGELSLQLHPADLLLYSADKELLSSHALKFLKYYASDVRAMRFRLKYVVYGFYWQHPQQTQLSGLVSSFLHLDDPQLGGGDLMQLLQRVDAPNNRALVIGDLNHFGGWYCKYCQQPDEIIAELHAESSSLRHVRFPNDTRNRNIDASYLHKLIANGIYVDGRTQLTKVRRYTDKYYAPLYTEQYSSKFGNLLANLYETLDDDIENDAGDY